MLAEIFLLRLEAAARAAKEAEAATSQSREVEMREMTGGCLCGQVRYSANADPAFIGVCHCKNCQKQTGTAFSIRLGRSGHE